MILNCISKQQRIWLYQKLQINEFDECSVIGEQLMKCVSFASMVVIITLCVFSLPLTAAESNQPPETAKAAAPKGAGPRITFEKTTHDFGSIGPQSAHSYEFKFSNTGEGTLDITNITTTCGCTIAELKKKQYQPGESGAIKVTFTSGPITSSVSKQIFVNSSDSSSPKTVLTIRANIIRKVEYHPQNFALSLRAENGGCTDITIKCIDNQPFAIADVNSIPNCITAKFDPSKTATQFVLHPIVDVNKLKEISRGELRIRLTHPDCKLITMGFNALPLVRAEPATVTLFNLEPNKPDNRGKSSLISNYDEDFEIESASSRKGYCTVKNIKKTGKGNYELTIEVVPPPVTNAAMKAFVDTIVVKTKQAGPVEITCIGYYAAKPQQPADANKK